MSGKIHVGTKPSWQRTDAVALLVTEPSYATELFSDQAEIRLPPSLPSARTQHGPSGWVAAAEEFAATWEPTEPLAHRVSEVGAHEVMVWTTGPVCARATGRPLELDIRTFFRFEELRIASVRSYWRDTAAALVALGRWTSWA